MTTVTAMTIETGRSRAEILELVEALAAQEGRAAVIVSEGDGDTVLTTRAELAVGVVLHR